MGESESRIVLRDASIHEKQLWFLVDIDTLVVSVAPLLLVSQTNCFSQKRKNIIGLIVTLPWQLVGDVYNHSETATMKRSSPKITT